jgi:soluble lytic murein transglycosylase-like protein
MRPRNVLGFVGLLVLVGGLGSNKAEGGERAVIHASEVPSQAPTSAEANELPPSERGPEGIAQGDAVQERQDDLEALVASAGPLSGLEGAATALASKDYTLAVALAETVQPPPKEGSDPWFTLGALQGRALRMSGRPADAVEVLEPLWKHRRSAKSFPRDTLGLELARARLDWARSGALETKAADAQREKAVDELGSVRRLEPLRNLGEIRIEQTRALTEIEGSNRKSTIYAAKKAIRALDQILSDYPLHPAMGDLWLERAKALARAERVGEAARDLRKLALERAGEPEAEAAWAELEALASAHRGVTAEPFSVREDLDRATHARRLRRVELSRELLDRIVDDPDVPSSLRDQAVRSRSFTAYKQRDFSGCADDLRPVYEATKNLDVRNSFLRCLERAGLYDEAIDIWVAAADGARKGLKANALWEATQLAVRGGKYERAEKLLAGYENVSKGHAGTRAWLHAWLPYRLGQWKKAIEKFKDVERYRADRTRARYFRGKLLIAHGGKEGKTQGAKLLRGLAQSDPYDYYGLQARQRLLDAGLEVPPLPELVPMADEPRPPTRTQTQVLFASMDDRFGDAWPPIRRGRQLYEAGYLEEARREYRVAVEAWQTNGKRTSWPRSEGVIQGLGWQSSWKFPRVAPTKAGRTMLRNRDAVEDFRVSMRTLARALEEPYDYARLTSSSEYTWKPRWQPRAYRGPIEREARLRKVDPIHLWSLMYTESRFRRHVVSVVGARGALQIMPWTARQLAERLGELEDGRFDDDTLFDIDTNAHLASYYIAELLHKFHGQAAMAYASYNGGPYNVSRWLAAKAKSAAPLELDAFIEEMPFRETYRYTRRVMEVSAAYAMLYRGEVPRWTNEVDPDFEDNIDF